MKEIIKNTIFHDREKIIGRRPSEILVLTSGTAKHRTTDKYYRKAHALNGHETFRLLVLVVLKLAVSKLENKS